MSAKAKLTRAVILAVLGGWTGRAVAQPPAAGPEQLPAPSAPATSPLPAIMPPPSQIPAIQAGLPPGSVPDPWISYDRPGCCGPVGANGPIDSEVYVRTGPSITNGSGFIRQDVNTGWLSEFGARSLIFNRDTTSAWTADIGIDYTFNDGGGTHTFPLLLPFLVTVQNNLGQTVQQSQIASVPVSIRDYQRSALRLSGGKEWYIGQPAAYCPGSHWRYGIDVGGRWGTSRLDLNDTTNPTNTTFRHVSDVYGALVLSLHSDLEFQVGPRAWLLAGVRGEWAYNWSDILRQAFPSTTSDTQEVNILLTLGVRF